MAPPENPTNALLAQWQRAQALPAGKKLFNFLLRRKVPYSGTIKAQVEADEA